MRSVQTSLAFPLSSVKPLEGLRAYRSHCIALMTRESSSRTKSRTNCIACGSMLEVVGQIESLMYLRCSDCSSLFLQDLPIHKHWGDLLREVNSFRQSPSAFQQEIATSRNKNVFEPKLEWIEGVLRLQEIHSPRLVEVATGPSEFTHLLESSRVFSSVSFLEESEFDRENIDQKSCVDVAVLLESLDRSDDPAELLHFVRNKLDESGLVFITALVSSGFDISLLGLKNMYLYPPDRTNCFSLDGLQTLLDRVGFDLIEVSTPGVLDVEIVEAHLRQGVSLMLSSFETLLMASERERKGALQTFLQENRMSSFARIVGRKR